MRFLVNNKINDSTTTITVNNENTNFPKENMLGNILVEKTEFDDNIVIDFGSAVTIDSVGFIAEDSGYTLQAHTADSWGSPAFSTSLTAEVTFISQSYRYWRLYKSGFTGFVNYLYLGEYLQMPGFIPNTFRNPNTTDITNTSQSAQNYTTEGVIFNTQSFEFPGPTWASFQLFETWYRSSDRVNHFMFVPYENSMTTIVPYYAKLGSVNIPDSRFNDSIPFEITIREVK
jgi:hypothetical protein